MDHADGVPIAELLDERRHLLDVAHWMLGSPGEAESVVDETYRRWYGLPDAAREQITAPRPWLAKTAGGICLDRLMLPGRTAAGPGTLEEEVGRALLDALDFLTPAERATFVLNDVFGMAPRTVADIVGRTEPECADLADRARDRLRTQRSRPTSPEEQDALARAVLRACVDEDAERLASLLCPDVTAFFDGGGKVRALTRPVHGSRQVALSLLTLLARCPRTTVTTHSVNGRTGLIARYDQQVAAVISLDIADRRVTQVWAVLNPDKLHSWNRQNRHRSPAGPGSQQSPPPHGDDRS
jgi:RNA polymerase sigma-70 factor, ECF subfamily